MRTVLKLGGSLITEKDRPETLDGAALDAAADAIAARYAASDAGTTPGDAGGAGEAGEAGDGGLVLVHGAGSFGHHHADAHGVSTGEGTRDAGAVLDIHGSMKALNQFVLSRLRERGVPAVPVHPLSVGSRDASGALSLPLDQVATLLAEGFVPVLHGDGVAHAGKGVTILSGDEVVVRLARDLDAARVGLCSTVPGVLGEDGEVIPRVAEFAAVESALGGSDATDVTGGMAGKVRALLELDAPAHVFGADGLDAFLDGGSPGTRIERE